MRITRRLEFDAGHRIPNHASRCRHLHGHRYALEVTLAGEIVSTSGDPEQGMLIDFSDVKAIARDVIVDRWDHAFLAWREDRSVLDFLATLPEHRTIVFDAPPTAEHLAETAFKILESAYDARYGQRLCLQSVRVYETPSCWADALKA
jgi:6-pyruvoyltetrahydropterin/6-carboxytetrahydropterin synthase